MHLVNLSGLKVALVHDWLNGMRGGEKVLEYFCELFPKADIFTLHSEVNNISAKIRTHKINHSFIQNLPFKKNIYRYYLPLYPWAVRGFNFNQYELIISTSHCAAKNITPPANIPHLCYCFSPMRYLWVLKEDYFGRNGLKQMALNPVFNALKKWDVNGSGRVTGYMAVSRTVQKRISEIYDRDSVVVYPPVDIPFSPVLQKEDYYLVLSALVPYKRVEIAIEACTRLGVKLIIAGSGTEMNRLKKISGSNVSFVGWTNDEEKKILLKNARALLFPGLEDFGIVPLESMSFATPVIAFGQGGVTETVVHNKTGILFQEQTIDSMMKAMETAQKARFETGDFAEALKNFSPEIFMNKIREYIFSHIQG